MVDMPHIQGPGGMHEPQPAAKKPERSVDADKFHKEMHKKVEKVSETDEEQKKKRKHQEEVEEEEPKDAPGTAPATPITPFSLTEEKKKVSPLDMQKGEGVSPLASAQPAPMMGAPPPQSPAPLTSAPPEPASVDDTDYFVEETGYLESFPTVDTPSTAAPEQYSESPSEQPRAVPYPYEDYTTPASPYQTQETEQPTEQPSEPPAQSKTQKKKAAVQPGPPSTPTPKKPTAEPKTAKTAPPEERGVTAENLEQTKASEEDTTGFFEQYVDPEKEKMRKKEVRPREMSDEELLAQSTTPVSPLPPSDYIEKEKKKEEEAAVFGLGGGTPMPEMGLPPPPEAAAAGVSNPYALLHPEAMNLFDRMVGVMTVMTTAGITETVVSLDSPKFASSVFFGSQIIIQEYSSAPRAFNIQINGSPQALALLQGNADDLMAAFQYGNYNFRVNRLDTGLLSERPLVKRKGQAEGGKKDQRGSKK